MYLANLSNVFAGCGTHQRECVRFLEEPVSYQPWFESMFLPSDPLVIGMFWKYDRNTDTDHKVDVVQWKTLRPSA